MVEFMVHILVLIIFSDNVSFQVDKVLMIFIDFLKNIIVQNFISKSLRQLYKMFIKCMVIMLNYLEALIVDGVSRSEAVFLYRKDIAKFFIEGHTQSAHSHT